MAQIYVINSNGDKELFSFKKVYNSARRVGASRGLAQEIAQSIEKEIYPGIKTSEIFNKVKKLLHQETPKAALRFNLREGIRRLGPTGFPFEKFINEVFKKLGFETKIDQYLSGYCLNDYETDLLAKKGKLIYVGECKFRNLPGDRVHLHDALANHARFLDILKGNYFTQEKNQGCEIKSIMITNTKFTSRAIDYSYCAGIELLGWRYPKDNGLENLIEENGLYPITILPSLKEYMKEILISENLMLVQEIISVGPQEFAKKTGINLGHLDSLIKEAKLLLESK